MIHVSISYPPKWPVPFCRFGTIKLRRPGRHYKWRVPDAPPGDRAAFVILALRRSAARQAAGNSRSKPLAHESRHVAPTVTRAWAHRCRLPNRSNSKRPAPSSIRSKRSSPFQSSARALSSSCSGGCRSAPGSSHSKSFDSPRHSQCFACLSRTSEWQKLLFWQRVHFQTNGVCRRSQVSPIQSGPDLSDVPPARRNVKYT
jgi:hypothetical protein